MRASRGGLGRAGLVLLFALASMPAAAQSPSPFQSAPGPAPPVPRPVPPHHRPPPREEPTPPPVAPTPPPPDPARRFDGLWAGNYACGAGRGGEAFQIPRVAQITNGSFVFINTRAPGAPGYWQLAGTVAPDGSFNLIGDSISTGRFVAARGERSQHRLSGRIDGDRLTAADTLHSGRGCGLTMTRRP